MRKRYRAHPNKRPLAVKSTMTRCPTRHLPARRLMFCEKRLQEKKGISEIGRRLLMPRRGRNLNRTRLLRLHKQQNNRELITLLGQELSKKQGRERNKKLPLPKQLSDRELSRKLPLLPLPLKQQSDRELSRKLLPLRLPPKQLSDRELSRKRLLPPTKQRRARELSMRLLLPPPKQRRAREPNMHFG